MLVCPSCREANEEGNERCRHCGVELRPSLHTRVARRSEPAPIEITPPALSARWPRITAFAVVLTGVLTWIVWLAVNPGPCHGKFNSDRFDYCLEVPGGWSADSARIGSVEVDQFSRGGSAAFVMAVQLRSGATLATYAQLARTQIEGAGLTPGPQHDSRIGDQPAVEWRLSTKDHAAFRGVQLVTVVGDTGWTVQLDADADAYDENLAPFRSMLASWHFR